jgi:hypothetical protein
LRRAEAISARAIESGDKKEIEAAKQWAAGLRQRLQRRQAALESGVPLTVDPPSTNRPYTKREFELMEERVAPTRRAHQDLNVSKASKEADERMVLRQLKTRVVSDDGRRVVMQNRATADAAVLIIETVTDRVDGTFDQFVRSLQVKLGTLGRNKRDPEFNKAFLAVEAMEDPSALGKNASHLIGHQFGGPGNKAWNFVPDTETYNKGRRKAAEMQIRAALDRYRPEKDVQISFGLERDKKDKVITERLWLVDETNGRVLFEIEVGSHKDPEVLVDLTQGGAQ